MRFVIRIHFLFSLLLSLQAFGVKELLDEKIKDILGPQILKEYLIRLADKPDEYFAQEVEKIRQKKMSVREFIQLGLQEQLKNAALKVARIDRQETTPAYIEEFFKELQSIQKITQSNDAPLIFQPEEDFTEEQKTIIKNVRNQSPYLRKIPTVITTQSFEALPTSQEYFKVCCNQTIDMSKNRTLSMKAIRIFVGLSVLKNTDHNALAIFEGGIRHEFSHAQTMSQDIVGESSLHAYHLSLVTQLWYGEKKTNPFKRACEYQADQLPASESLQAAKSVEYVLCWLAQSSGEKKLNTRENKSAATAPRVIRYPYQLLGGKNDTHPSLKKRIACIIAVKKLLIAEDNLASQRSFLGKIF